MRHHLPILALVACLGMWLWPLAANARNQVHLEVDKDRVAMGDVLRCDITFTIEDEDHVSDLRQPTFEGFNVADKNSSQQQFTSIVNFHATSQKVLTTTYVLEPKTAGSFTIGPASFLEDGRRVESERAGVQVVELKAAAGERAFGQDALSAPLSREEARQPQLFVRLIPEKGEAYEGERLAATLYLYTARVELSRWSPQAPSQFPGFSSLRLDLPKNGETRRVQIGRNEYRVDTLDRFLLTAKEPGAHTITPYRARVLVGDGFFGGRWVDIASQPLALTVKALPTEGRPADFDPSRVGRFEVGATLDRRQTEVGQPVTYILTLTGTGDVEHMALPAMPEIQGLKIYPPTTRKDSYQKGVRLEGRNEAEYLIVPQAPGRYTLPALPFAYFDTETNTYRQLSTPAFDIEAAPGNGAAAAPLSGAQPKQTLESAAADLKPLRPKTALRSGSRRLVDGFGVWIWIAAPFVMMLGVGVTMGLRRLAATHFQTPEQKWQRAKRKQWQALKARAAQPDDVFYGDLKAYLYLDAQHGRGTPLAGLSYDQLVTHLTDAGETEAAAHALVALLEACDAVRYAPGLVSATDLLVRAETWRQGGQDAPA